MGVSDPLGDTLTKIRNASRANHPTVDVKPSRLTERVLDVLRREGFIRAYTVGGESPPHRSVRGYLKYSSRKAPAITQVVRVSKPGQREYRPAARLPRVLRGLGVAVISTSSGVITDREAYRQRVGGEVLCYVW